MRSTRSASLFPPSSLILHNGGLLEYSLKVKDMGWGFPLLGFYSRLMTRSPKGYFKVKPTKILNKNTFHNVHVFSSYCDHIVFALQMTFKCKNNRSNVFSVFKVGENEVLHRILGAIM